jgi:hypothetical protein
MKCLLLFCYALFAVSFARTVAEPAQSPDTPAAPHIDGTSACPLHLQEAYITTQTGAVPVTDGRPARTLHVGVVNVSGKTIISFVTHAVISLEPGPSTTDLEKRQRVTHTWTGEMVPRARDKEEWQFIPEADSTGVIRVSFNKVKFQDGSVWTRSPGDACSFAATGHVVPANGP